MEGIKIRCQCAFSFYVVFGEGCHLVRCPKCHEYIDKDGTANDCFIADPGEHSGELFDNEDFEDTDQGHNVPSRLP